MSAFVAVGSTTTDELKKQVMEHHWALRRELPTLETLAWNEARTMTSLQTVQMMRALEALKNETIRHLKFAEVLVHPFVGQARAEALYRNHIADQRVVEKALDGAFAAARGEHLRSALAEVKRRVDELLGLERLFGAVPRR